MMKLDPTNPYTRQPLSIDTRQRLRKICIRRNRRHLENLYDAKSKSPGEVILSAWTYMCQIIIENGFFEMSPLYFTELNRSQLFVFVSILQKDIIAWAGEHKNPQSRRHRYIYWITRLMKEYAKGIDTQNYSYLVGRVLVTILNDYSDNYPICFMIMSALHRL